MNSEFEYEMSYYANMDLFFFLFQVVRGHYSYFNKSFCNSSWKLSPDPVSEVLRSHPFMFNIQTYLKIKTLFFSLITSQSPDLLSMDF